MDEDFICMIREGERIFQKPIQSLKHFFLFNQAASPQKIFDGSKDARKRTTTKGMNFQYIKYIIEKMVLK